MNYQGECPFSPNQALTTSFTLNTEFFLCAQAGIKQAGDPSSLKGAWEAIKQNKNIVCLVHRGPVRRSITLTHQIPKPIFCKLQQDKDNRLQSLKKGVSIGLCVLSQRTHITLQDASASPPPSHTPHLRHPSCHHSTATRHPTTTPPRHQPSFNSNTTSHACCHLAPHSAWHPSLPLLRGLHASSWSCLFE